MSDELPAEDLLARVARQDVAALGELYDRYAPRVFGLVAHVIPARADAEETLQEVFLRLWSESPSLSLENGSVVAWLVVTAREAAVERLRALRRNLSNGNPKGSSARERKRSAGTRKSKAAVLPPPAAKSLEREFGATRRGLDDGARASGMGPLHPAWLPEPRDIALIDDRLDLLHKVLNQLPKSQRQALELAVFGGLGESEIAAEMGEPLGKVRSSLRAAVTFVKHRRRAVCGTWAANI